AAQSISYLFRSNEPNWSDAAHVTLHDLRKTFGSLLIAQKVDIYRVSKLLRHSSVTVTESHYIDILDRDLEDTVKKLDCLF
ncbi:MAG: tyrosine-type recombinase/integrase, partial [FCB group bacterium]|nr:tyrosine-type recombinase/integrase [FCB group bacterium]